MFSSCSEWENCYFPQSDKSSFYDDIYNDCGADSGEPPGHETSLSLLPKNQYRNISSSITGQSVDFNLSANNQFANSQATAASSPLMLSRTEVVNFNNQHCAYQSTTTRHHPYQRSDILVEQQHVATMPPPPPPLSATYHPTQQIVYQTSNCNENDNYMAQQQQQRRQQQHFQQQQQHCQQFPQQQLVAYNYPPPPCRPPQPPPLGGGGATHSYNLMQPITSQCIPNNYFGHNQQPSPRTPSIPCQGNQPWTYAYCYGYGPYSDQEPCQYTQVVDIEDFMNNEKRKERSRDAARCRRSRETEIFTALADVLPLKKEDVQQLDKASIMRIAIAYLKVRDMLKMFPKIQELCGDLQIPCNDNEEDSLNTSEDTESVSTSSQPSPAQADEETSETQDQAAESDNDDDSSIESALLLKQTLDGFLLILSNDGDITYVTDNICDYLGISKIDILGQQIWEYAHQCDHAELKEALNIKRNGLSDKVKDEHLLEEGISTDHRDLFVRLKCTLTSRGRSINIKSASYKVIHITGHLVVNAKGDRVLVAMGRPIPHPSNIEIPMGTSTFLTKHSLDMKFIYVDDKMLNLMGYKPEDLLETSLFNCHHGIDSDNLMVTFKNVLTKGQGETCRYRFLGKYGGYCWIVTQATIVYDKLKPQSVVCVNYVISNLEKRHEIYTLQQYEESQNLKLEKSASTTCNNSNNKHEILITETKDLIVDKSILTEEEDTAAKSTKHQSLSHVEESVTKIEPLPLNNNCNKSNINSELPQQINEKIAINSIKIKREQLPTIIPPPSPQPTVVAELNNQTFSSNSNNTTAIALSNSTAITPTIYPQNTLLPHCPTTTVTRTIFEQKSTPSPPTTNATVTRTIFEQQPKSTIPLAPLLPSSSTNLTKFTDDKGPKTVTSSILRPAPVLPYATNLPTTTSTQSILQTLQPLNVAPGAQSVTASLFVQRSQKLPSTTATAAILAKQQTVATATVAPQTTQQHHHQSGANQQDMNKGYLTFAEDATELTMLKEEPDDLTAHLVAPNAVDACLPLDETTPLFNEMLVGLIGSYGSLLPDDINSLDSSTSSSNTEHNSSSSSSKHCSSVSSTATYSGTITTTQHHNHNRQQSSSPLTVACATTSLTCSTAASATINGSSNSNSSSSNSAVTNNTVNSANIDPFINNAHDESNDTLCSQHLLSPPSVTSKSPEGSSLPSLCSPNSLSQEDEFSYYTMNVDDMDDLTMRAPYIPMNEQDDLPLLTSDDFMWSSGNAFTADDFSLHTKDSDNLQALQINPSINYHQQHPQQQQQQQFTQQQQQFSSSLCSSPASTVSSMSPSPLQQQQHQQQQHSSQHLFPSDSSELAALLCGSGNGTLSLLQDTNALQLTGANACGNNGSGGNSGGGDGSGSMLSEDLDTTSSSSNSMSHHQQQQQLQQHQFQQQCLQQLQDQLQQHQRQQQQQQLLSGLNINCKKEKFDTTNSTPVSLTSSLCDSIEDSFDSVYTKTSTNLDCWNDFLQINATTDNNGGGATSTTQPQQHQTSPTIVMPLENLRPEDCKQQVHMQLQQEQQQQQQKQQQQQQQNIIINAVPLITIQSNNKNLLISSPQQSQNASIPTTTTVVQTQSNTKMVNKINTIKVTPVTTTATIRIIENKQPLMQQQQHNIIKTAYIQAGNENGNRNGIANIFQLAAAGSNNNKRHMTNSSSHLMNSNSHNMESKRLKSNNIMDSQLLQQLMTTPKNAVSQLQQQQQQQQTKESKSSIAGGRWSSSNGGCGDSKAINGTQIKLMTQQQQSNSVLKNLLISGCDEKGWFVPCDGLAAAAMVESHHLTAQGIDMIPILMKPELQSETEVTLERCLSPSLTSPLRCMTISATPSPSPPPLPLPSSDILLNCYNNPLIGGPGVLLSPTLTNDDSNPPGLMPCDSGLDVANDSSGIDDTIVAENMSPLKRSHDQQLEKEVAEFYGPNFNNVQYQDSSEILINGKLKLNDNGNAAFINTLPPRGFIVNNLNDADEDDGVTMSKRKRSISYMDSSNPLMTTPFLMDLCNDDYNMNTKEFLEETDIDNVLSVWPSELV